MRLRGDSKWNCENVPSGCGQPDLEAGGGKKVVCRKNGKLSVRSKASSPLAANGDVGGRRPVLREKTNLEPEGKARRGGREKGVLGEVLRGGVHQPCDGGLCVEKGVAQKAPEGVRRRVRASPQAKGDEDKKDNSLVSSRKRGNIVELPTQAESDEKDSVETRGKGGCLQSPKQVASKVERGNTSLAKGRRSNVAAISNQAETSVRGKKAISLSPKQVSVETECGSKSLARGRRSNVVALPENAARDSLGARGSSQSPKAVLVVESGSNGLARRGRSSVSASPNEAEKSVRDDVEARRTRGSFKSPKQVAVEPSSKEDSMVAGRRRCVYMNAASDEPSTAVVPSKESVYEFEVDGSEPPSRRRRRRKGRGPTTAKNRKRAFPRFPRVRFPSRSETTCSSVESVATLSSFDWGSSASEKTVPEGTPASAVTTSCKPRFVPPTACAPRSAMRQRKRLSTVLESPAVTSTPAPSRTSPDKDVGADSFGDSRLKVHEASGTCGEKTPSKVPRTSPLALDQNDYPCGDSVALTHESVLDHREKTPSKAPVTAPSAVHGISCLSHEEPSSLGASVLTAVNSSFALGFAHHHSTPVKARSGSDLSSNFSHSQVNDATADKCFGFSSDDDDDNGLEGVDGLPSPLLASPHTVAQRQALFISSPPQVAPSRFAPEVVRRALILEAVSRPLQFDGVRHKGRLSSSALPSGGDGLKKKKVQRKKKLPKELRQRHQGIDEYLLKRQELDPVESRDQGGVGTVTTPSTTPPSASLFGDAREEVAVDGDEAPPLSVRPPRRSYERPWNRKLKKVIGGGLCLDSSDEEDEGTGGGGKEGKEEEEVEVREAPKVAPPPKPRHRTKATENKENQLDQWASQINSQFNEVEDFELCLN